MEIFLPHFSGRHMIAVAELVCAVGLDSIFGEPRRAHPLVGFGKLALNIEVFMMSFIKGDAARGFSRLSVNSLGVISVILAIVPLVLCYVFTAMFFDWQLPSFCCHSLPGNRRAKFGRACQSG